MHFVYSDKFEWEMLDHMVYACNNYALAFLKVMSQDLEQGSCEGFSYSSMNPEIQV